MNATSPSDPSSEGTSPAPQRLTLASYNIHRCYGRDGRCVPDRIADVLREIRADVVAVQEVETQAEGGIRILEDLARETGSTMIPGPTMFRAGAQYGNALLTRLPVQSVAQVDLSVPGREPRGAIDVRLDAGAGILRVCASHLGLRPSERRRQVRQLLIRLATEPGDIDVLIGDINEWLLWGRPLRWLHRFFIKPPAPATFPARWPLLALDRIWVRPRRRLERVFVHRSATAREASDHLPVVAWLTPPAEATGSAAS
jgi:phospholipase D1/2